MIYPAAMRANGKVECGERQRDEQISRKCGDDDHHEQDVRSPDKPLA
jgi:hypothetical protein